MGKSNRYKELRKLINAGYPLYAGIGFILAAAYVLVRLAKGLLIEKNEQLTPGVIVGLVVLISLAVLIGAALIKVGMESKDEEEGRRD